MWIKENSNFSTKKKANNKKYEIWNKHAKYNTQKTYKISRPNIR